MEAPSGVEVRYDEVFITGEDNTGDVVFVFTSEGLIIDVWATDVDGNSTNAGTSSEKVDEIAERLCVAPANHWDEIPGVPLSDWRFKVSNGETRLGYHDWATRVASRSADATPRSD